MTRRLVIQGGSDSAPFRVSSVVAGDAGTVDKFSLIFDGNQMPLRKLVDGVLDCPGLAYENMAAAYCTRTDLPVYSTPSGLFPLYAIQQWIAAVPGGVSARGFTVSKKSGSGIGGVLANGYFYGLVFSRQAMIPVIGGGSHLGPMPQAYICYSILRNYG